MVPSPGYILVWLIAKVDLYFKAAVYGNQIKHENRVRRIYLVSICSEYKSLL